MTASLDRDGRLPARVLVGRGEPIFDRLPRDVLENLHHPRSENALVWNLIYPLARPKLSLAAMLAIRPLWGSALIRQEDPLQPYFWGYSISAERLPGLDVSLGLIDGSGKQTEADLFLLGHHHLVVVEAKHMSGLGRCARYANHRCPEIHPLRDPAQDACRYWERPPALFSSFLDFGPRPMPEDPTPACSRHYQLARTLLVGQNLAQRLELEFHLWLITPKASWRSLEAPWLDFAERVREDELWKRLRVLAWEDLRDLDDPA